MNTLQKKTREYNKQLRDMIKNPRWIINYKGKEVRKYPFFRQAANYCRKHQMYCCEEKLYIVDLETGEQIEFKDNQLTLF